MNVLFFLLVKRCIEKFFKKREGERERERETDSTFFIFILQFVSELILHIFLVCLIGPRKTTYHVLR